jgi:hypothetical protein
MQQCTNTTAPRPTERRNPPQRHVPLRLSVIRLGGSALASAATPTSPIRLAASRKQPTSSRCDAPYLRALASRTCCAAPGPNPVAHAAMHAQQLAHPQLGATPPQRHIPRKLSAVRLGGSVRASTSEPASPIRLAASRKQPTLRTSPCVIARHSLLALLAPHPVRTQLPMKQCTYAHNNSPTHSSEQPGPTARTAQIKHRQTRRKCACQRLHTRSCDSVACKQPTLRTSAHTNCAALASRTSCATPGPNPAADEAMHAHNNSPTHCAVQPSPADTYH